jgi:uncharacterized protein (DUF1697 family)
MTQFIILLRAINVGGNRIVKMADLKALLLSNGYSLVKTYIQSGNVILHAAEESAAVVAEHISKLLTKTYAFEIPCIALSAASMKSIVAQTPFTDEPQCDKPQVYIGFVQNPIDRSKFEKTPAEKYFPEQIALGNCAVYYYYPLGAGVAKISSTWLDKQLLTTSTVRNLSTCNKLLELCTNTSL